jgi:hypothetical protein
MSGMFSRNSKGSSSEVEWLLATYILDDGNPILSTLDMNRLASYTYGEVVREQLFERLETLLKRPESVSVLSLQKSLCLIKHLILYGSEPCVNLAWNMSGVIETLQRYYSSAPTPTLLSQIMGGQVDRTFAIREMATELRALLSNPQQISMLRHQHQATYSSSSLVPVGSTSQVGFAPSPTEAHQWQEHLRQLAAQSQTKSNVAKPDSSFGGGTANKVISAAYSLDDMIRKAQEEEAKKRNRYFDNREEEHQWHQKLAQQYAFSSHVSASSSQDLLDIPSPICSTHTSASATATATKHSSIQKEDDLLGLPNAVTSSTASTVGVTTEQDLLLLGSTGTNLPPASTDNIMYTTPNIVEDLLSLPSTTSIYNATPIPPPLIDSPGTSQIATSLHQSTTNSSVPSAIIGVKNYATNNNDLMSSVGALNTIPYNDCVRDFGLVQPPPINPPSFVPSMDLPPPPLSPPPPPPPLDPPQLRQENEPSTLSMVQQLYLDQQQQLLKMQQQLISNRDSDDDNTSRQLMAMIQKQQEQLTQMVNMASNSHNYGAFSNTSTTNNIPSNYLYNNSDIMGGSGSIYHPSTNL